MKKIFLIIFISLGFISCTSLKKYKSNCYSLDEMNKLVILMTKKITEKSEFNYEEKILSIKIYNTSCYNHLFNDEELEKNLWNYFLLFEKLKKKEILLEFNFEDEFNDTYYSSDLNLRLGVVNNFDENSYLKIKENNCFFYIFNQPR